MTAEPSQHSSGVAYLLSWDGHVWRDVVRLRTDQIVTVGRAATNKIVLADEACSRNHCELFHADEGWTLRDLGSRNGTRVGDGQIKGDYLLESGDLVAIGVCRLAFTTVLDQAPTVPTEDDAGLDAMTATYAGVEEEDDA